MNNKSNEKGNMVLKAAFAMLAAGLHMSHYGHKRQMRSKPLLLSLLIIVSSFFKFVIFIQIWRKGTKKK